MKRRHYIEKILMSPQIIFGVCSIMVIFHLITDSTALKIWKLSQKKTNLIKSINSFRKKSSNISLEIKKHYMPSYLEEIAIERFDMAEANDLIFVFSQKEPIKKQETLK